jgi:hypothetical protein
VIKLAVLRIRLRNKGLFCDPTISNGVPGLLNAALQMILTSF